MTQPSRNTQYHLLNHKQRPLPELVSDFKLAELTRDCRTSLRPQHPHQKLAAPPWVNFYVRFETVNFSSSYCSIQENDWTAVLATSDLDVTFGHQIRRLVLRMYFNSECVAVRV